MKKFLNMILLIIFLSTLVFIQPTAAVSAAPRAQEGASVLTFAQMGESDLIMRGPFSSKSIRFNLPANRVLQEGAELQLVISASFTGESGGQVIQLNDHIGAVLDVYFNDAFQQSIPLINGNDIVYRVPIASSDLVSKAKDGTFDIYFELDASIDCNYAFHNTTVVISSSSQAILPSAEVAVDLDLHRLPWPIYQPDAQLPGSAVLVMPKTPSADEAKAALLVMAAFGRMTDANLLVDIVSIDDLTDTLRQNSDLIFVGKPSELPLLKELDLPVPIQSGSYSSPEMKEDDGVLQIAASAWSKTRVVLLVSGNTDVGVVKAAQALTTSNIQTSNSNLYSIVAQVNLAAPLGLQTESPANPLTNSDYTFSSLGYSAETNTGIGTRSFSYEFVIPPGQVPVEKPYIDIVFTASKLADPARSGMTISVNGSRIGSAKFSVDDPDPTNTRANLPAAFLRSGLNVIDVNVALIPFDVCSSISFNSGLWVTIYSESVLHLPLARATATTNTLKDLQAYPYPFLNDPSLSSTTFILPQSDPAALAVAGALAFDLGNTATGSVFSFDVDFDGQLEDATRKDQNLILVGEPSSLSLINDLKDNMPAYFEPNSNTAILEGQQVVYRISSGKSLGYLELFSLPWDNQFAALEVLGTNVEGVLFAGRALVNEEVRNTLKGDFATIDNKQTMVVDTRTGAGMGRVAFEGAPGEVLQTLPDAAPANPETSDVVRKIRNNSLIGLGVVVGLMIIVALIVIRQRRQRSVLDK